MQYTKYQDVKTIMEKKRMKHEHSAPKTRFAQGNDANK